MFLEDFTRLQNYFFLQLTENLLLFFNIIFPFHLPLNLSLSANINI